jgi:hypothetical protein
VAGDVSVRLLDKLTAEKRKLLQDAALETCDFRRAMSWAPSAEKAKPVVEKQKQAASPDLVNLLETELAKARGKS